MGQAREAQGSQLRQSTLANSKYYGMGIGLTAVSGMLWEGGLLGTGLVFVLFLVAIKGARRVVNIVADDPWQAGLAHAVWVGLVLAFISLFHKNLFMYYLPYQVLVVTMFGYVAYWLKRRAL